MEGHCGVEVSELGEVVANGVEDRGRSGGRRGFESERERGRRGEREFEERGTEEEMEVLEGLLVMVVVELWRVRSPCGVGDLGVRTQIGGSCGSHWRK